MILLAREHESLLAVKVENFRKLELIIIVISRDPQLDINSSLMSYVTLNAKS